MASLPTFSAASVPVLPMPATTPSSPYRIVAPMHVVQREGDDTVSYIRRFQTVNMSLTANPAAHRCRSHLPPHLQIRPCCRVRRRSIMEQRWSRGSFRRTVAEHRFNILLHRRSDNFSARNSGIPPMRFDPEGRVSPDARASLFSDEYDLIPAVRSHHRSACQDFHASRRHLNVSICRPMPTELAAIFRRVANKGWKVCHHSRRQDLRRHHAGTVHSVRQQVDLQYGADRHDRCCNRHHPPIRYNLTTGSR